MLNAGMQDYQTKSLARVSKRVPTTTVNFFYH